MRDIDRARAKHRLPEILSFITLLIVLIAGPLLYSDLTEIEHWFLLYVVIGAAAIPFCIGVVLLSICSRFINPGARNPEGSISFFKAFFIGALIVYPVVIYLYGQYGYIIKS
jgi:F0F1-type ATP synthase membrane subunit c/vacuolar-type H+-ATPase subunit K